MAPGGGANIQRGLWRLWIVASIIWIVGSTYWTFWTARVPSDFWSDMLTHGWVDALLPPLLVLASGYIVFRTTRWITRGFRKDPR